ncbi:hypothetical protein BJ166DRAFT_537126 [Pestalotiopsis sp. NC0098]|nr:hypothetical protein BJ166DRAFT_537126 [Pestalotiopsis sp. NC0098]
MAAAKSVNGREAHEETTPLLSNGSRTGTGAGSASGTAEAPANGKPAAATTDRWQHIATPEMRLMMAAFLITVGLCFTQVPILYAFKKMACEDFYEHAEPYTGDRDRCSRPEIDASIARQVMILGMSTICCGILNLSITGASIKNRGPRFALLVNTFFPVLRVIMQAVAVGIGSRTGIILMQTSQLFGIVGGPAGYLLTLNTAIAELVESAKRTASFGKLQGAAMFGTAIGFLLGGIVGELTIIRRPFEITAVLLSCCFVYCFVFVPYIDPKTMGGSDGKKKSSKSSSVLHVLGPQTLRLQDGRTTRYYGLPLLAVGTFVAVLAVGYAPSLTQMYSIMKLEFVPTMNSAFMFMTFTVRGVYLMFVFPQIIKWGRRWFAKSEAAAQSGPVLTETIPTEPRDLGLLEALPEAETLETTNPPKPVDEDAGAAFDLFFLRWSMLGDAIVTGCIGFAALPWHIFLAGFLLPFFSGSDAASKGVLTDLVPAAQRPDALQAITFVGYVASLSTAGVFGSIFSALAEINQAHLTFFCNAAVALLAILILTFVRIPPQGSTIETSEDDETESEDSTQEQ